MVIPFLKWPRYIIQKLEYSLYISVQTCERGQIRRKELWDYMWKNFFKGQITYLHLNKGEEMAPTIAAEGGTLLVRSVPYASPDFVFVGDVVVVKDPEKSCHDPKHRH